MSLIVIEKAPITLPLAALRPSALLYLPSTMLSRSKRRALTTDDLMRRQELRPRKRQKRVRDEDEDGLQGSDDSASGEDSQSEGLSTLDEDEDGQDSTSEISIPNEEGDAVPSRFSFKFRQDTTTKKNTVSSHASPLLPLTFADMGVSLSLVSAMNKMSIHTPTEIQAACIPPLLDGMYFSHSVLRPQC